MCGGSNPIRILWGVNSAEIRKQLRRGEHSRHDTRHIHDLARAIAHERLHLKARAPRPGVSPDLLWDPEGAGYKVVSRTVTNHGEATTFEASVATNADFLLAVFLQKPTYRLIEIVRLPWPTVLWLGNVSGDRVRLRWSRTSPAFEVAERL